MFSAVKEKVDALLNHNEIDKNGLTPILMDIHKQYNHVPHEVLIYIAYKLNISHSKIYSIAKLNNN